MLSSIKLSIHKTLFGNMSSFNSDKYSMECVDVSVSDFSTVMGMDSVAPKQLKPYNLFSREEQVICIHEFKPTSSTEKNPESVALVGHITTDKTGQQQVAKGSTGRRDIEKEAAEEEDEKNRDLVKAAVAVLFPLGDNNSRRKYTSSQVSFLFDMYFIKKVKVPEICAQCNIKEGTARGYLRDVKHIFEQKSSDKVSHNRSTLTTSQHMDNAPSANQIVTTEVKKGNQKLYEVHSKFLVNFFECNEMATLEKARQALLHEFSLPMSTSGIHQHMRKKGCLVVKCLEPAKPTNQSKPKEENALSGDYVFIDAVDMLMYVRRSFGWRGGEPLSAVHSGIVVPTLAAFCDLGVVNVSIVTPVSVLQSSEHHKETILERKVKVYQQFLIKTMQIIEKQKWINRALVISDIDVFNDKSIQEMVELRGFKLIFRPFFSFQKFWWTFKNEICRQELTAKNPLVPRISLASEKLSVKDFEQFIQLKRNHQQLSKCL